MVKLFLILFNIPFTHDTIYSYNNAVIENRYVNIIDTNTDIRENIFSSNKVKILEGIDTKKYSGMIYDDDLLYTVEIAKNHIEIKRICSYLEQLFLKQSLFENNIPYDKETNFSDYYYSSLFTSSDIILKKNFYLIGKLNCNDISSYLILYKCQGGDCNNEIKNKTFLLVFKNSMLKSIVITSDYKGDGYGNGSRVFVKSRSNVFTLYQNINNGGDVVVILDSKQFRTDTLYLSFVDFIINDSGYVEILPNKK